MLKDLYDYAQTQSIVAVPGFKNKKIDYYICLSSTGEFTSFSPNEKDMLCPNVVSVKNSTDKCNIFAEKADIVLCLDEKRQAKFNYFKTAFSEALEYESTFQFCIDALDGEAFKKIKAEWSSEKRNINSIISFKINEKPICAMFQENEKLNQWWAKRRKALESGGETSQKLCLITGESCEPMRVVPTVKGLAAVGGQASGDRLICFDKAAFTSYNLEQSNNACVSENAITAINLGMEKLLSNADKLCGAKIIHWYKEPIKDEMDIIPIITHFNFSKSNEDDGEEDDDESYNKQEVTRLIQSTQVGEKPIELQNRYYIMTVSGAGGRVMIRNYMQGSLDELYKSYSAWMSDLSIIGNKRIAKPPKLYSILIRLLKLQKGDKSLNDRMEKELSALSPQVLYAAINNTPLPDVCAVKALQYIRSKIYSSSEEETKKQKLPDTVAHQILKLWLIRKIKSRKEEVFIMEELNSENPSIAYHCGRMLAIFAAMQAKAIEGVNAGIVERYYSSAMTTPALVLGRLSAMSNNYLGKLNDGQKIFYKKKLQEIAAKIGNSIPATLNLEEQSQFALGYYQQCAELFSKKETSTNTENN